MSEFTVPNWLEALSRLYEKAEVDQTYRDLCLTDPRTAISEVSDIELPADFKVQFFGEAKDMLYTFLLPKLRQPGDSVDTVARELIRWSTFCTMPTTGG